MSSVCIVYLFVHYIYTMNFPFSALPLFVGRQEWHPGCKKVVCWSDDVADLTAALHVSQLRLSPPLPSSLAPITSRMEMFWYWLTQLHLENGC